MSDYIYDGLTDEEYTLIEDTYGSAGVAACEYLLLLREDRQPSVPEDIMPWRVDERYDF